MTRQIIELQGEDQWAEAFPLMSQLRPYLTLERFIELVREMAKNKYKIFVMKEDERMLALAGVQLTTNLYNFYHVFLHDLVVDEQARSTGIGAEMLDFVHQWGREQGAEYVSLESAVHRVDAHRFYEKYQNYDKWCYSFRKKL